MQKLSIGDIVLYDGYLDIVFATDESPWVVKGAVALAMSQSMAEIEQCRLIRSREDNYKYLGVNAQWYADQKKVKDGKVPVSPS